MRVIICVDNEELKQDLEDRQQAAEEKETQIVRASSLFEDEDDNVMERIFNSLTGKMIMAHILGRSICISFMVLFWLLARITV